MMGTAIETHAHPPRVIMLCPSSRSFFRNGIDELGIRQKKGGSTILHKINSFGGRRVCRLLSGVPVDA